MMRVKTPHFLRTSLETFPIQCYGMQCYGDLQRGCSAREWFLGFDCLQAGFHACGREAGDGARLAAFRSPPPPLRAPPLISLYDPQRRQGAAALLAAVTTTKPQGIAPSSHGRTSREEKSSLFPATLRERGPGGEAASLREAASPPESPHVSPSYSSGEGVWGRGASLREAASPPEASSTSHRKVVFMRRSGILMHISSLPGPGGIGSMGREAYAFADFLRKSGMSIWQVLPLGPTGYGESPYQSASVFAGNPMLISCQRLREEGLLKYEDREEYVPDRADCVDYDAVRANKETLLRKCFQQSEERLQKELAQFARENDWVEDFALFIALKQRFGGGMWTKWPDADIRLRKPEALARYRKELDGEARYHLFCQYLFFRQWFELKKYCNGIGTRHLRRYAYLRCRGQRRYLDTPRGVPVG